MNHVRNIIWLFGTLQVVVEGYGPDFGGWCYTGNKGPDHWCEISEACCGKRQSPIHYPAVADKKAYDIPDPMPELTLTGYSDTPQSMAIVNDGHTVTVVITSGDVRPTISGGVLSSNKTYIFDTMQFSWGSRNDEGSEHTCPESTYSAEIGISHYSSEFSNMHEAALSGQPGAVFVLGVLYKVSEELGDSDNCEDLLKNIVDTLPQVKYQGQSANIATPFPLIQLFKEPPKGYFQYHGSIPYPPCTESVLWTHLPFPFDVCQSTLDTFRSLYFTKENDTNAVPMVDNHRPTQPLNGRTLVMTGVTEE